MIRDLVPTDGTVYNCLALDLETLQTTGTVKKNRRNRKYKLSTHTFHLPKNKFL
jgi:hypothetical protein